MPTSSSRGQSQVVTAVILAAILIAGISAAYTWGLPLLQKNQEINSIESSISQLDQLQSSIESLVARSGSTTEDFTINSGFMRVNASENAIIYTIDAKSAYVTPGEWVPLNERDMQGLEEANLSGEYGVKGKDKPGVVLGKADLLPSGEYRNVFKLKFRPLEDLNTNKVYLIDLVQQGNTLSQGGTAQISLERLQDVTEERPDQRGPLVKQQVRVQLN